MGSTPLILIQARNGGTRFPGKINQLIGGRRMLDVVIDKCRLTGLKWMLCRPEDWPEVGEDNVLGRFATMCLAIDPKGETYDPIIRVTADCPLLEPWLVGHALALYGAERLPVMICTTAEWDGLDVEVIPRADLARAHRLAREPYDREHVTNWLKQRGEYLPIRLHDGPLRFSVDDAEGLGFVRGVFRACEHCRAGVGHRYRTSPSGISVIWDLHDVYGLHEDPRAPEPMECMAYDLLRTRIGGETYVSR